MIVLLVEDDMILASAISDYLHLDGIECDFAYNGLSGLELALQHKYDIILLDVMLPKMNGFSLCNQIRDKGISTPIIMLTAKDSLDDKLDGFRMGTDDYITKPFAMAELSARIKALSRRRFDINNIKEIGDLCFDHQRHKVFRQGEELKLSPLSWRLLEVLVKHSPNYVSKETLEQEVWGEETSQNNLKVQMHKLRGVVDKPFKKHLIHSIPKIGFVLRDDSDA